MNTKMKELRAALKSSVVEFEFTKLNGEKRKAKGTTNLDLIPKECHPKQGKTSPDSVIRYFDFTVNGYRSISVESDVTF